jgi:hypothetical protein
MRFRDIADEDCRGAEVTPIPALWESMRIDEVIFTDGVVRSIRSMPDGVMMEFVDYNDSTIEIVFSGDVSFEIRDCIGYAIAGYKLEKQQDSYSLIFTNDENTAILSIRFRHGDYSWRT